MDRQFQRQQNTNQGNANVFRGKSETNQVALLSLELKAEEAKNG